MKLATSFLAALLLTGTLGAFNNAMATGATAKDGILSIDDLGSDPYCHEKFPAIRESSLNDEQPVLQDSMTGDVIDFYGPCDENPVGKDQVREQKLDDQRLRDRGYSD